MKVTMDEIRKWEPLSTMENATDEVYLDRIQKAYTVELPHNKLTLIPYIGKSQVIQYSYDELVALCPVTFILDIYKLEINFIPGSYIPELKSLKFYLLDYKDLPISHEHILSRIFEEFKEQVKPASVAMKLHVNVRGGITTTITMGDSELV